jgi:hypothetical protein
MALASNERLGGHRLFARKLYLKQLEGALAGDYRQSPRLQFNHRAGIFLPLPAGHWAGA